MQRPRTIRTIHQLATPKPSPSATDRPSIGRGHANCQPTHANNPVTGRGTSSVWGPTAGLVNSVSILCQSRTNRQILHQFINSSQSRQLLHIIEALVKSSKTTTDQTTFPIGHGLATSAPIPDQSEDSSAHKRGTSILCGPTEVSQRRTISHAIGKSRASSRLQSDAIQMSIQPIPCQSDVDPS